MLVIRLCCTRGASLFCKKRQLDRYRRVIRVACSGTGVSGRGLRRTPEQPRCCAAPPARLQSVFTLQGGQVADNVAQTRHLLRSPIQVIFNDRGASKSHRTDFDSCKQV